jgi:GDP/UDP-N,N'-diacetylbacillosamine 2-epimerase (hydrolysing)
VRHILYISGTRADFGLMASTLQLIAAAPALELSLLVTGMHLDPRYGETVREIEQSGLIISGRVPVPLDSASGATMARAIGLELCGMVDAMERDRPDLVLLLGDRGEMLAGAIAALHLNIPVVHIHGGERSGTVDEPVRHAISRLAHYHFTATGGARERLVRMGEKPEHIFVTGAPGLDGIVAGNRPGRAELFQSMGFDAQRPLALVVFHPVVQQAADGPQQTQALMQALLEDCGYQALVLLPNADAGGEGIREIMLGYAGKDCRTLVHLPREEYLSWLGAADLMVGNSSSGIIEAASLGTAVVNVGDRQSCRERSENVVDVSAHRASIAAGIARAEKMTGPFSNVYGDGQSGVRIVKLLANLDLDKTLLMKSNAY